MGGSCVLCRVWVRTSSSWELSILLILLSLVLHSSRLVPTIIKLLYYDILFYRVIILEEFAHLDFKTCKINLPQGATWAQGICFLPE
jgi:hypothetical protein